MSREPKSAATFACPPKICTAITKVFVFLGKQLAAKGPKGRQDKELCLCRSIVVAASAALGLSVSICV
jgi:hypothetical protein